MLFKKHSTVSYPDYTINCTHLSSLSLNFHKIPMKRRDFLRYTKKQKSFLFILTFLHMI